jgi:hypothetical protein
MSTPGMGIVNVVTKMTVTTEREITQLFHGFSTRVLLSFKAQLKRCGTTVALVRNQEGMRA